MRFERRTDRSAAELTGLGHGSIEKEIAGYANLVGRKFQFLALYPVPSEYDPSADITADELIQFTGSDGRFTVELFRLEGDQIKLYVVGRREDSATQDTTETVFNGPNALSVRPNEVLSQEEATRLLQDYFEQDAALDDSAVTLRELSEFARTIDPLTNAGNQPAPADHQAVASQPTDDGVDFPLNLGRTNGAPEVQSAERSKGEGN